MARCNLAPTSFKRPQNNISEHFALAFCMLLAVYSLRNSLQGTLLMQT